MYVEGNEVVSVISNIHKIFIWETSVRYYMDFIHFFIYLYT